jgi:acylphosphatase
MTSALHASECKACECNLHALHSHITGRVQGVGFRWRAMAEAKALHLSGWVRNNADNSVEVWAEGDKAKLEQFAIWLRHGPPYAWVEEASWDWCAPTGAYRDFSIR